MSLTDFLLGSSEDAQHLSNIGLLDNNQKSIFDQLANLLKGQVGQGVPSFPGQYTPDANQSQQGVFDFVNQLLSGGNEQYGAGQDVLSSIMQPWDDTGAKEYWETSYKAPMMQQWEDDMVPALMEKYASMDALDSGASRRALADSAVDLNTNMASTLGNVLYQDKNQHTLNQMNSLGPLMQMLGLPVDMGLSAGATQYGIDASKGNEAYQDWMYSQGYNNPWINNYLSQILGTSTFAPLTQGATQQSGFLQDVGVPLISAGLQSGGMNLNPMSWF